MVCLLREAGEPLDEFSFKFDVPVEEGVPSCPGTDASPISRILSRL
jgi:hypothetical protein